MMKRKMIQCAARVNRDAVRRESIDGVEHIVVTSYTLPDDIVMNGGLYPADEIDKSFMTLERTLAPVEHPTDSGGNFLSASDPEAIHNFHAGAFNQNVVKEGNRIRVDKYINVQEAMKSEKGLRLLDRINEIETNDNPRPIHTSTRIFLEVEPLGAAMTNAAGDEYDWIAHNMVFDHDAILLDSVAAATPSQGVGMAVNEAGDKVETETFVLNSEKKPDEVVDHRTNAEGISITQRHQEVMEAFERSAIGSVHWIEELYDEEVIFSTESGLFSVPYRLDDDRVTIVGIPIPVERNVTFTPKTNCKGDPMKEAIVNALKEAGIEVNDLDDAQLLAKYNELQAIPVEGDGEGAGNDEALAGVVANALKPIADKLEGLEATINAQSTAELEKFAEIVGNSEKYPGIDAEAAKLLGLDKVKEMAANCGSSFGVSPVVNVDKDSASAAPADMPE